MGRHRGRRLGRPARRYAALAAVSGEALAAGSRIADPATFQRYALAVLESLDVRLDVRPDARQGGRLDMRPGAGGGPLRVRGGTGLGVHAAQDTEPGIGSAPGHGTGSGIPSGPGPGTGAATGSGTGTLIVANHSSWLDVLALTAAEPVPLVAKREVAGWPVIGALARRAGTRFVDRDALRQLPGFVDDLAAHLRSGKSVAVFPQGTTWCTPPGGPFRRAAFQAALDAGAPVRPVAVGFTQAGSPSSAAAYVGDDTLAASLRRVVAAEGLVACVRPCAPLWPRGHDRRSLAEAAYEAVRGAWNAEPQTRDPA